MKKRRETIYQYETVFEPTDGVYMVTVPKLPGLVTQGDNLRDARGMAKDAIRCYLEAILKDREFKSRDATSKRERIRVAV
ncbi:MAG: type II toxin-antitoxin system HicB family antitoxin [Candidatus Sungbacteria bacterium]|uniref:Type II toxin-antitoxin system HicB family antitoxin n=1 Tax=Candidatus Sungiibacteriota bacterium TaxID=2750080 RepID=A0A931SD64_9BACT|nr:type II toxin-antitoxin system HicB family antitoxin [Candidatus Sungbacteria bacterium]